MKFRNDAVDTAGDTRGWRDGFFIGRSKDYVTLLKQPQCRHRASVGPLAGTGDRQLPRY